MATATKGKNGKVAAEVVFDAANKAAEEAKVITDSLLSAAGKATEDTKVVLDAQYKMMQSGFDLWQQYSQSYFDFVIEATQQNLEQSLAFREKMGKSLDSSLKKAEELMMAEQELILEASEAFQAQIQASSERFAKLFTPNFR